YELDEKFDRL
nr:Chain C, PEPTIDE [Gallus gallus]